MKEIKIVGIESPLAGCSQEKCDQPGLYRFTWPGKDEAYICEIHVGQLRGVAAAIGLHLQVRSILGEADRG